MNSQLPREINDFMFSVLYSDGTPLDIKRQAHELITYFNLTFDQAEPTAQRDREIHAPGTSLSMHIPEEAWQKVVEHLKSGQKINAIKELRSITNWGLKEAKDAVDDTKQWGI